MKIAKIEIKSALTRSIVNISLKKLTEVMNRLVFSPTKLNSAIINSPTSEPAIMGKVLFETPEFCCIHIHVNHECSITLCTTNAILLCCI